MTFIDDAIKQRQHITQELQAVLSRIKTDFKSFELLYAEQLALEKLIAVYDMNTTPIDIDTAESRADFVGILTQTIRILDAKRESREEYNAEHGLSDDIDDADFDADFENPSVSLDDLVHKYGFDAVEKRWRNADGSVRLKP